MLKKDKNAFIDVIKDNDLNPSLFRNYEKKVEEHPAFILQLVSTPLFFMTRTANDDFHLLKTDTVARNNGTDLSGDGNYPFDEDAETKKRIVWDMTVFQYKWMHKYGDINCRTTAATIGGVDTENINTVDGVSN